MSTRNQCLAIVAAFKNRWFDTGIAFDHLRVQSIHRRLSDIESMVYRVFTTYTPEQLAKHDASTSRRYQAAAQEAQATIAKHEARIAALEAHIREAADEQNQLSAFAGLAGDRRTSACAKERAERHLAALNHTEGKKKIDDAVDKAWGRFCAAMPDDQSPYPGMAKAFEVHYGVSWTDRDWRNEQSTWAAAWRMAWDRRATVLDAEQDAARLDFLDSIGAAYGFEDTHEGNRWMIDGPFNSLRAAIDAAIDAAIEKGGANGKVKVPA